MEKIKSAILLSLFIFGLSPVYAAEISIKECLTAEVDVAALNSLNKVALSIFPYTFDEPKSPGLQKVTVEEFHDKYDELLKKKETHVQYQKLLDNLQIFFVSGGVMIKDMDAKVRTNNGYFPCGRYRHEDIVENIMVDVPDISPLLQGAVAKKLVEAAGKHQDRVLGRTADTAYFLIFGYSSWGAKNRQEMADFNKIMFCTIDQIDDSGKKLMQENPECEQIKKSEQYGTFRVFLTSSILAALLIHDYTGKPFKDSAFGLYTGFFKEFNAASEKQSERPWVGGAALSVTSAAMERLSDYYRKSIAAKKNPETAKAD